MKRFFTTLMVVVLSAAALAPAKAQTKGEWSIKGGVGYLSVPDLILGLAVGLGSIDNTEGVVREDFTPMVDPTLEFHYGVNNWLALGGSATVGYLSAKTLLGNTGAVNKSVSCFYNTLCVNAISRYFTAGKFSMYGSWGVGAMLVSTQQRDRSNGSSSQFAGTLMANVYPLCFSVGGSIGGFCELGWGAKGFANVGAYFNF